MTLGPHRTSGMQCSCHRPALGRRSLLAATMALAATGVAAQPSSAGPANPALIEDLVLANRILFDQGVVDAFGHVSARHDKDPNRYLLSRSMAPALVTDADIIEYDMDSNAVNAQGRASYLERFIHGAIYRARPDVMAVIHSHSAAVIPFANTKQPLLPMNHISAFLGIGVPVFEIRDTAGSATDMLVRNQALADALAVTLGQHDVALMRGHGSVAVGRSVRLAVYRGVYTEVNARMEADALRLGQPTFLSAEEAKAAAITADGLIERPWSLWRMRVMGK